MSNKKVFMSVTASAIIAASFMVADSSEAASHTVKRGDSLWDVAQKYNTNVLQLKEWNNLSDNYIYLNQVLEVGDGGQAVVDKAAAVPVEIQTYTVKNGDTLSGIAFEYGLSARNLMSWNGLDSTLIYPGNIFIVGGVENFAAIGKGDVVVVEVDKDKVVTTGEAVTDSEEVVTEPEVEEVVDETPVVETTPEPTPEQEVVVEIEEEPEVEPTPEPVEEPEVKPEIEVEIEEEPVVEEELEAAPEIEEEPVVEEKPEAESPEPEDTPEVEVPEVETTEPEDAPDIEAPEQEAIEPDPTPEPDVDPEPEVEVEPEVEPEVTPEPAPTPKPEKPKPTPKPEAPKPVKPKPDPNPVKPTVPKPSETDQTTKLINAAKSAIGTPYLWAGINLHGFDCSGFIYWAHQEAGIDIDRLSTDGYDMRSYEISKSELKVGDLVFFAGTYRPGISHMGIYVGNNQFIHAGTSTGVTIASLDSPYWSKHFDSFKRFY